MFWNNIWSSVWSLWRTANDFKAWSEVIYQETITLRTCEKWFSLRNNIWYEFNNLLTTSSPPPPRKGVTTYIAKGNSLPCEGFIDNFFFKFYKHLLIVSFERNKMHESLIFCLHESLDFWATDCSKCFQKISPHHWLAEKTREKKSSYYIEDSGWNVVWQRTTKSLLVCFPHSDHTT